MEKNKYISILNLHPILVQQFIKIISVYLLVDIEKKNAQLKEDKLLLN